MKQKSIINDTFEKHKKLVLEHLNQTTAKKPLMEHEDVEFSTTADIDMKKMGKPHGFDGVQVDNEVSVSAEADYEDNTFDYEYGSIRGRHDPGSYWSMDVNVYAAEDIYGYDADGNKSNDLVFKKGELIDNKFITSDSMEKIQTQVVKNIEDRGYEGDFDDDPRSL
jgi:hypothetical protein